MTIIAYLLDCHCRYDERSIVQKKNEQIETLAKELGTYQPWLKGIVPCTALAVLWLANHRHEVESMVAQGLVVGSWRSVPGSKH